MLKKLKIHALFIILVELQKSKVESAVNNSSNEIINVTEQKEETPKKAMATQESEEFDNYPPAIKRKAKEPRPEEIDVVKQLQDICFNVDPNEIYKDMIKIGQG